MEEYLRWAAQVVIWAAELIAILVIAVALVRAVINFVRSLIQRVELMSERIRLDLGRSLALTLELLLAADVLQTAIAPSWQEIGQLAAIAAIRTALNFFLEREINEAARSTRNNDTKTA